MIGQRKIGNPPLPREHGSWAVVIVPFIVGAASSRNIHWRHVVLFLAVIASFLASVPLRVLLRNWLGASSSGEVLRGSATWLTVYTGFAALAGGVILFAGYQLLPVFVLAASLFFVVSMFLKHQDPKSLFADLVIVPGLTITAPAAWYIGTGSIGADAGIVWILTTLFFGSGFVYVQTKIRLSSAAPRTWKESMKLSRVNLFYHGAATASLAILAAVTEWGILPVLAFTPMALHASIGIGRNPRQISFKRLGFILVGHSVVFAAVLLAGSI